MKTLVYLMLSFIIIVTFFASFIPIPFLGVILSFALSPLSHKVSWRELFFINTFHQMIYAISNIEMQIFVLNIMIPQNIQGISMSLLYVFGISAFFIGSILSIVVITISQRLFYCFLPKRLRIESVGY